MLEIKLPVNVLQVVLLSEPDLERLSAISPAKLEKELP